MKSEQPLWYPKYAHMLIRGFLGSIREDGDLTSLPVPNSSQTYPNAAYGHMDDEIRLGYQAGLTSLHNPIYGRL